MVLPWSSVAYGAVLSATLAAVLIALTVHHTATGGDRHYGHRHGGGPGGVERDSQQRARPRVLRRCPDSAFPISWQDTGSGVFALALAALVLGLGPLAAEPGRRVALTALLAGLVPALVELEVAVPHLSLAVW